MRAALLVTAALAAIGALASQGLAQPAPPGGAQNGVPGAAPARSSRPQDNCFNARFINGFTAPDEETVYVRVGVRDVYRLKLFAPCLNVDWSMAVALKSRTGSDWICRGMDAELIVPNRGMGPQRCPVTEVRKLTPEEVAALPKKARP
jgi:hypothetical protein